MYPDDLFRCFAPIARITAIVSQSLLSFQRLPYARPTTLLISTAGFAVTGCIGICLTRTPSVIFSICPSDLLIAP